MQSPRIVGRETPFTTPWLSVIAKTVAGLPGTTEPQVYYGIEPGDYVTVLPIMPDKRVVVVRQYRPIVEAYTLELPSGHVDLGHTPEEAARQELLEQTGYVAGGLELLGSVVADAGRLVKRQWNYLATDLTRAPGATVEAGIEVSTLSLPELRASILDGTFDHALNLAVLLQAICAGRLDLTA